MWGSSIERKVGASPLVLTLQRGGKLSWSKTVGDAVNILLSVFEFIFSRIY